ncbi:MAG: hypothetical protein AAFR51_15605 [Pseudomonadota bacterium]
MSLETTYYITQIIAVALILGSLIAIFIQQRKDHALAKAENQREILLKTTEWFDAMLSNPSGLESVQNCLLDFKSASSKEKAEFMQYIVKVIVMAEQASFMKREGLIDEDSGVKFIAFAAMHLGTPGGAEYWNDAKVAYANHVVEAIDKRMTTDPISVDQFYKMFPLFKVDSDPQSVTDGRFTPTVDPNAEDA